MRNKRKTYNKSYGQKPDANVENGGNVGKCREHLLIGSNAFFIKYKTQTI
jgi:hypothetical protein